RFFFRLPLLKGMMRGDIHFVGVIPRTTEDVEKLSPDWKKLYLSSKVGVITMSDLEEGNVDKAEKCYASETLYAVRKGFWYDLQMFFRWLGKKWNKLMKRS